MQIVANQNDNDLQIPMSQIYFPVPSCEDVNALEIAIAEVKERSGLMDYHDFRSIRNDLADRPSLARYLTGAIYMKMPKDQLGRVKLDTLMYFFTKKIEIDRVFAHICQYDIPRTFSLDEDGLRQFISDLVPRMRGLGQDLDKDLIPYYAHTAVRKLMFNLDPRDTGRVSHSDLLTSPLLWEFLQFREFVPDNAPESSSWFSAKSFLRVYAMYLGLDDDENGMLSLQELAKPGEWMLTSFGAKRIMEESVTFNGEMDYKGYLNLVLSLEDPETIPSKRFLWNVVKADKFSRSISFSDVNVCVRSLIECLSRYTSLSSAHSCEVLTVEIFDMLNVPVHSDIEFEAHICKSPVGGHTLAMLIDAHAFWKYDNREALLMVDRRLS